MVGILEGDYFRVPLLWFHCSVCFQFSQNRNIENGIGYSNCNHLLMAVLLKMQVS